MDVAGGEAEIEIYAGLRLQQAILLRTVVGITTKEACVVACQDEPECTAAEFFINMDGSEQCDLCQDSGPGILVPVVGFMEFYTISKKVSCK